MDIHWENFDLRNSWFSNFLKFVAFYEEHIRCDAIILGEIVLFSTKAKSICLFLPINVFDTSCDWCHISKPAFTCWKCEIYSKLTLKTPERHHWRRSGVFIVNVEHISHLTLVLLFLTLNLVVLITLLLSKMYFCRASYRLFDVPDRKSSLGNGSH